MSYKMRYRVTLLLISPQNAEADAKADDVVLFNVGDVATVQNADGTYTDPTGPILTSMSAAVSAIMGVNNRVQSGLKTNVRFQVFGKPVGTPEDGAEDIPAEYKAEQLYITGDTPNAGLLFYIRRANRKPVAVVVDGQFLPPDHFAEPQFPVGAVAP